MKEGIECVFCWEFCRYPPITYYQLQWCQPLPHLLCLSWYTQRQKDQRSMMRKFTKWKKG